MTSPHELRLRATLLSHYELPWLGVGAELAEKAGPTLFPDSTRVRTGDGHRHWRLNDSVRRSLVLQVGFAALRDTWERIPRRPSDDRQWAIDQYVGAGMPVDLDSLSLPRLRAVAWLARWLGGAAEHVPTGDELARELGVGELLEPFRVLAGDHFVGRAEVLRALETRFRDGGTPMLVHGLGGIGKSAVAVRHLLNLADRRRALVAYLNFDHSAVDPAEPVSLVAAIARQVTVQLTDPAGHDAVASLATRCHERLRSGKRVVESPSAGSSGRLPYEDLIERLAGALGGERLLVVFDTFEEVQRRDRPIQRRFSDFLGGLSRRLERPSIVLAGRSPAPELDFDEIRLDGLDHDEAVDLLLKLLPAHPPPDARRIVDQVGTSPLALHLAAGVLRNASDDEALRDIAVHRGTIEGELYRRLLGHIQDPDVRRLAHPGLTLRRVTPELIRDVLAKPCGVDVPDAERASALFDGLAREAMLVTRTPDGRAVVHRADVRQTMLHRLAADESVVANRIHRAAVKFYSGEGGVAARAEEIYHRLMLGQRRETLDTRWDGRALAHLLPTLDDLPSASKAYLAAKSPTLSVSDEDLRQADTEVGRRLVTRRAAELVSAGNGEDALWELDEHVGRTDDESPVLSGLRVQALEQLGRYEEALSVAVVERKRLARTGAMQDFVLFTLHMARMDERLGQAARAKPYLLETLGQTRRLPPTGPHLICRLSLLVCLLRLRRYGLPLGESLADDLGTEAVTVADRLSIKEITVIPGLLRDLAAELGERSPRLLNAALRRIGLAGTESELALDQDDPTARDIAESYQSDAESALYRDYQDHGDSVSPHGTLPFGDGAEGELARRFHRSGRAAEALPHYDRAIGQGGRIAPLLLDRGLAHLALDNVQDAERDLSGSLRLAREQDQGLLRAHAHRSLGTLARHTGDFATALRHYELCLRLYAVEAPDLLPAAQLDQAKALLDVGLSAEADTVLDEALPALRRQSSGHELAQAELVAAAAKLLQDDPEEARKLAASAQRRFARRHDDDWVEIAKLTRLRVDTALALAGTPARSASVARATALADRLTEFGLSGEAATAKLLGVRLAVYKGQLDVALSLLRQVRRPGKNALIEQWVLWHLARTELAAASGHGRALTQARRGLTELNATRDRQGGIDVVSGAAAHGRELGELAVELALRQGNPQTLLRVLEQTKAQVYRYRPLTKPRDPVMRDRVDEMRSVAWSLHSARREGRPATRLAARLSELQQDITRLAWHSSPWGSPRPTADLATISAQLGSRALVSFARSGETWSAVVVADGAAHLVQLGSASEVDERAIRLHADLDALAPDGLPRPLADVVAKSASHSAERLDRELLSPIIRVTGERPLIIVPTGNLHAVHWGALPSLRGTAVTVAPSATAWLAAEDVAPRPGAGAVVLVSGPGLPSAVGEVDGLRAIHPGAWTLTGRDATVSQVLDALDGAELAHVAAHGAHEPGNALFSRIELADGPLYAHEFANLRRPPRQVVLAASELALAHLRPGDEALGFAGALLASGSATIIGAVSRVGDQAAAAVSVELHAALRRGRSMAEALAEVVGRDPLRRPFICLGSGHRVPSR
ncbi:CHAT domain-containing protein [Amycolatopsis sp. lyj-108]|uniref:CHAT domain-containing protein n=1 Tax=Amycolatopsis sp. lyj-108 TaxID=2789286 RepID=UPI00397DC22E